MSTFRITMECELFKTVIEAISALTKECRLHVATSGLSVRTVDSANVAMVDLTLSSSACSEYECTGIDDDAPLDVGLDVDGIDSITSLMKDVFVSLHYADDGKLNVEFGGYRYTLPLLDLHSIRADPRVPEAMTAGLPAKLYLDAAALVGAVKAAAGVGERIFFAVDPEKKVFSIEGYDDGTKRRLRKELLSDTVTYTSLEKARSLYSHDYLKSLCKPFAKADDKIYLDLGNDHPVQFTFAYGGGKGNIKYLLAPRIEQD